MGDEGQVESRACHGAAFARRFHLDHAPAIVARSFRETEIGVTEIRSDQPLHKVSESFSCEDAYLVGVQLRDFPDHIYWEDGRATPTSSLRAGEIVLYDLKRDPVVLLDKPFHSVHFHLPRRTLDALAEDIGVRQITELAYRPGAGVADSTVTNLTASMLPGFERPNELSTIFLDHVTSAVALHVAQVYGGLRPRTPARGGGLAPWQERRATELLAANLAGGLTLQTIALECRLSVSHFSRCFRRTFGVPPHRWLLARRLDLAMSLLRDRNLTLADIADRAGFADQSHFTRAFAQATGQSPGAWRRAVPV